MSSFHLDKLFSPRSVALIGASPRPTSPGRAALRNLCGAGFKGPIYLINPHYDEIEGVRAARSLDDLPEARDLVVIAAPPQVVPAVVTAAGTKGVAAGIIITAGLGHGAGSLAENAAASARAKGLRLVGPNCLGVMVPGAGLNASFAASMPNRGDLALISQSGAIVAGLVEWAATRSIGFSAIVSLGDDIDVDFGRFARFLLAGSIDPGDPALCRIHQGCAQIHVSRAGGGARQAGGGRQVGASSPGRQGGHDPYRRARRRRCGL
jgi:acetyltransferase